MPLNTTVSHVSPLVSYIPRSAWYEGDSSDPDLDKYSNKSYHYSDSTASVAFSWWGTGIWVYGSRRNRTGDYNVVVDNGNVQTFQGYTGGPEEFQQVLFAAQNLSYQHHQIRITNTALSPATRSTLDIDYLVYETTQDSNGIVNHTDPGCAWLPSGQNVWQVDDVSHITNNELGAMELNFTGAGITVYGLLGENSAPLTVSIDGWSAAAVMPNTAISPLVPSVPYVLYTKGDLNSGPHTLRIENNPTGRNGSGSQMSVAYSQILDSADSSISQGGKTSSVPTPSNGETDGHHRTVVLAASFSALGTFLLSLLSWRLVVCYRARKLKRKETFSARPFLARANPTPQSSPQSPRTPRQRRIFRRREDDIDGELASLQRMLARAPLAGARRTRRAGHRRPPSDIEFAHSRTSSRVEEAATEACAHYHSRSYDEFGYPYRHSRSYPYLDEQDVDSELTYLRYASPPSPHGSISFSSGSSYTARDSLSMHVTAPPSPADPDRAFQREVPVTLPLRVNSKRQRRPSIEKPPLDPEQQLSMFASASASRRAGVRAAMTTMASGMRVVGSPVVSLPSSTAATTTGTGNGIGSFPRPLPVPPHPPPVPPLPMHLRSAGPGQSVFDPADVGLGLPPPYRLLDMH